MFKTYKYRIYPKKEQIQMFNKHFGGCRFVYNLALETKINAYQTAKINLTSHTLINQLTELKKEVAWLKELDSQSLQASIRNIDRAFNNFFQGSGYPKFKKKGGRQSFQCPNSTRRINWDKKTLTLPKMKNIPIVLSRKFKGVIKTITISKTATGKYFASILVDEPVTIPVKQTVIPLMTMGIDLGLKHFLITNSGIKIENPRFLKASIDRLKVLQRRKRNKKKGSQNWKKSNLQIAKIHEKISNQRTNFLQVLSTRLVNDSQVTTFCIESLAVKNLIKNHKLAQAISDVSWSEFIRMMKYKCEWNGKNIIEIGKFDPTSKTCSECGKINNELRLSDREWSCKECGVIHDRDINAAINIKNSGLRKPVEPVEKRTVVRSKKQELFLKNKNDD